MKSRPKQFALIMTLVGLLTVFLLNRCTKSSKTPTPLPTTGSINGSVIPVGAAFKIIVAGSDGKKYYGLPDAN